MTEYLIGFNDEWVPEHTPEQLTAKSESVWLVIEDMLAQGVLVYSHGGLDSSSVVGSVEAQHGEPVFSDGPYAETKEHLGGFAIVDVEDDAAARAWAARLAVALDWPQEIHRFPPRMAHDRTRTLSKEN